VFPHRYQLEVTEVKVYDCIPRMYSGNDIFSIGCSRHAKFYLKIEKRSGYN
jgi:hypothetical protein